MDYEDSESSNLILDVQSTAGKRRVVLDENNLVVDCCTPKVEEGHTHKEITDCCSTSLRNWGSLMVAQVKTPKKKSQKSIPKNKKYKRRSKPDEEEEDDDHEIIEFVEEEEEEEQELEVVAPTYHQGC